MAEGEQLISLDYEVFGKVQGVFFRKYTQAASQCDVREVMIRKLPDEVRHSLRSGFAVASVRQCVEELVLNSTDSGATCIAVRVDLETLSMQVVDNGYGLCEDDLDKVGNRYFTSKCHSLQDLDTLTCYGFRGEAIASIADVSSVVEFSSRWKDDPKTFTKLISNGKSGPVGDAVVNRPSSGTTVTIYNLFYNLPVRRKCIDPVLEFERVRQGMEALSLIQPSISYSLKNDALHSMVLKLPKSKDTRFRFCQVYGLAHSQQLREVGRTQEGFAMSGFISREGHYNTAMQHLYVNKRLVLKTRIHKLIDVMLRRESIICRSKASAQAGRLHAAPELHAVFIIDIQCHWREYDVCFEPAKTLIEFRDWDALLRCVEEGVRSFLKREDVFLDLSKDDDGGGSELTEESQFNESERDLHYTKEPDKNVFETVCERVTENYNHANLTSKSVCRSKVETNASLVSESPASATHQGGERALETPAQTHGENQSQCRTSECPPMPEDKKILVPAITPRDSLEPFKELYGKTQLVSRRSTAQNGGMEAPSKEDSDEATVAAQLSRCTAIRCNAPSVILDSQMASQGRFPPLDVRGLESQEEANPKLKTSSCSGFGNSTRDFQAECEAATHGSTSNEWQCETYRTSWHPPIPAKRKISLVTHRVDSLRRFKRPCGKTQHASSSTVQNNQTTVHAGSEQKTTPGIGDEDDMTETRRRILQSDFLPETPVPKDAEDRRGRLTTPGPLTLVDFANLDRNNFRQLPGLSSISAKLSKLKQNLKADSPLETTLAGDLLETQTTELSTIATVPPPPGPSPQTCCEQNVCTPEKPHQDWGLGPSKSPNSSDWSMVYDTSIGRNVFINRATGMSSYKGPQEENKALCQTDLTTMSIGLVRSDAAADPELCSLWCDLSRWENPVFKRHPTVAVNVSSGNADTLAVKIHNILYPYRFTKDMVNSMKVLQQVDNKFIACLMKVKKEDRAEPDGNLLVLVDQHAAHERVRLEQLIADSYVAVPGGNAARQVKVSAVNPPLELDVTEEQHRLLRVFSSSLSRVGLAMLFPESDSRRVSVGTVPLCFVEKEASETQRGRSTVAKKIVEELLREQVEMFQTSRAAPGPVPLTILKVLASQACHGAVKFNDSLTPAECRHLIQSLSRCDLPFQCAHGRPSILPLADISHLEMEEQEPRKPNLRRLRISRNEGP